MKKQAKMEYGQPYRALRESRHHALTHVAKSRPPEQAHVLKEKSVLCIKGRHHGTRFGLEGFWLALTDRFIVGWQFRIAGLCGFQSFVDTGAILVSVKEHK